MLALHCTALISSLGVSPIQELANLTFCSLEWVHTCVSRGVTSSRSFLIVRTGENRFIILKGKKLSDF